jgi:hypothetical protein
MPLNLIKIYNQLLDLLALTETKRLISLRGVFDKNFVDSQPIYFNNKLVVPCPIDGMLAMDVLFNHLTTVIVDKSINQREFDIHRAQRLHWVKYHIDGMKKERMFIFSVKEKDGLRTYLYDDDEKYVVIFEPKIKENVYFLLTAYHLRGKDLAGDKIVKKYKRRLPDLL